jgi:methylmalonyl-CoA epimerase
MIKRFFGINIAVKDFDEALKKYSQILGVEPRFYEEGELAFPGLKGASFPVGEVLITLMASEQPDTSIARFLQTRGEGVFLVTLEVTDVEEDMKELARKGVTFTSDKPLSAGSGKTAFAHPKSMHGVQWELFQPKNG